MTPCKKNIVRLALLTAGVLSLAFPVGAHTFDAPVTVQADATGCFGFATEFTAGPGDAVLASELRDGNDNTTLGALILDYFCLTTVPEGEVLVGDYLGCLVDPTQAGSVTITLSTCGGETFTQIVTINPCPGVFDSPTEVVAAVDGSFSFTASYTATCDGAALAGWDWFAVDNIEPAGLIADLFCASPLAAGESAIIPVSATLVDPTLPGTVSVSAYACDGNNYFAEVTVLPAGAAPILFIRGDADNNGSVVALTDAIYLLTFGFLGGGPPPCLEAADVDGNAMIQVILEALYLLNFGFGGGPQLAAPFPNCGPDPDPGASLGCDNSACP